MNHILIVRDRVSQNVPTKVRQCCGEQMNIRRSSLRDEPCADDVMLKCEHCFRIQTHGIPIERGTYESELADRGRRVLDMVDDGPYESVEDNLKALGYIDH